MHLDLTPDWAYPVTEELIFQTEVFVSRSGKEQRRSLRAVPRRRLSFTGLLLSSGYRAFEALRRNAENSDILIGDFAADYAYLARDAAVGATSLVTEAETVLSPGFYLLHQKMETELIEVTATGEIGPFDSGYSGGFLHFTNTLLNAGLTKAWPLGTAVVPCAQGRLPQMTKMGFLTNEIATTQVQFDVSPVETVAPYVDLAYRTTLGGLPVYDFRPDWALPYGLDIGFPFEVVDYGIGTNLAYAPVDFVTKTVSLGHTFLTRSEGNLFLSLFGKMRGRRGEFWWPTRLGDLQPVAPLVSGSSYIYVATSSINYDAVYSGVYVIAGAAEYPFTVTAIDHNVTVPDGLGGFSGGFSPGFEGGDGTTGITRLTLGAAASATVPLAEIDVVSWMHRARFASDALQIERITDTVSRTQVSIVSLEALP